MNNQEVLRRQVMARLLKGGLDQRTAAEHLGITTVNAWVLQP